MPCQFDPNQKKFQYECADKTTADAYFATNGNNFQILYMENYIDDNDPKNMIKSLVNNNLYIPYDSDY